MFREVFEKYNWEEVKRGIYALQDHHVRAALEKDRQGMEDFMALISPAAVPYLERMAAMSRDLTRKRFGRTIQLFAPLYLSNECQNICTYCGFSFDNRIKRRTLTDQEILTEAQALKAMGYEHILLVTGEAAERVGVDYIQNALRLLRPLFSHLAMEVQPLEEEEYSRLIPEGLNTVLVYQETYDPVAYKDFHPKGKKANFNYRLNTPDRLGRAGAFKIGLGALLGLSDWRTDSFFNALHLDYLEKTYWQTKYSVSFPRLRPAEKVVLQEACMSEKELLQLICAYRIFNGEVELSISTRESEKFRDNILQLGITSMSAGSATNPGGYAVEPQSLEQFEVCDQRSAKQVSEMIRSKGYEVMWKDWDRAYQPESTKTEIINAI